MTPAKGQGVRGWEILFVEGEQVLAEAGCAFLSPGLGSCTLPLCWVLLVLSLKRYYLCLAYYLRLLAQAAAHWKKSIQLTWAGWRRNTGAMAVAEGCKSCVLQCWRCPCAFPLLPLLSLKSKPFSSSVPCPRFCSPCEEESGLAGQELQSRRDDKSWLYFAGSTVLPALATPWSGLTEAWSC